MSRLTAFFLLILGCVPCLHAQVSEPGVSTATPGYTLHANAQTVLTDVTVSDSTGNPVHNLPESAFYIFDNDHPQQVTSFEEHTGAAVAQQNAGPVEPHTFSNQFLLHPPPAFNVLVLDTWTIGIVDQMYLNEQLTHFIEALPANQLLAIYVFASDNAIPLQTFTANHKLLLAALHKAIPRLRRSGPDYYNNGDLTALRQIADDLSQFPGRKNLIWFSGGSPVPLSPEGSPLLLRADPTTISPHDLQVVYDLLNSERIAIYPIDARGLQVYPSPAVVWQHLEMRQQAEATGGQAYINTNGLEQAAAHILSISADFYTLSYSPASLKFDDKWHKVKVKVNGGDYTLSYRSGYFDDGTVSVHPQKRDKTLLRANGVTDHLPANRSEPIIFSVEAKPAALYTTQVMPGADATPVAPGKDETTYTFRYTVPAEDFNIERVSSENQVQIGAGILIFNQYGRPVGRTTQAFTLTFHTAEGMGAPKGALCFDQQINLHKGEDHVAVAVWDLKTGRLGTTRFPLEVGKRKQSKP